MKPGSRRALTCSASGALGLAAAGEALTGNFGATHALAAAGAATFLIPTLIRNCPWFGPITTSFPASGREIWLTIDDGPDPDETPAILEVLSNHGAKALFFHIGNRVLERPDLALTVLKEGHLLGNHTQSHPAASFWAATPRRASMEISRCSETLLSVTGTRTSLFRTPVGLANPFVHAAAERAGLRMVGWSANGFDGVSHDPERVVKRIMRVLRPGGIALIHEGRLPGMKPGTRAKTLDMLLHRIGDAGYRTVLPCLEGGFPIPLP
jgi:peptidoglycan/xylan/chitin deacetylase (PgdA/CDA1 family)